MFSLYLQEGGELLDSCTKYESKNKRYHLRRGKKHVPSNWTHDKQESLITNDNLYEDKEWELFVQFSTSTVKKKKKDGRNQILWSMTILIGLVFFKARSMWGDNWQACRTAVGHTRRISIPYSTKKRISIPYEIMTRLLKHRVFRSQITVPILYCH